MRYKVLISLVIIALMFTSLLPGCNEERQLVIPSSLSPQEVLNETANAGPPIQPPPYFYRGWSAAECMYPWDMPQGATREQFVEGFYAAFPEVMYTKRNGERAGWENYTLVVVATVLKYENSESAERSFVNISETNGLQNSTYEGIALKNGTHTLTWWQEESEGYYWDDFTQPCYLLHSGCFVIQFYGRQDVLNDMLDRIIGAFGVSE